VDSSSSARWARGRQLQLGPVVHAVDSSSSARWAPTSDSSSSARWCARRTAPARPRWRAHAGQLQLGPVARAVASSSVSARRAPPCGGSVASHAAPPSRRSTVSRYGYNPSGSRSVTDGDGRLSRGRQVRTDRTAFILSLSSSADDLLMRSSTTFPDISSRAAEIAARKGKTSKLHVAREGERPSLAVG